MKRRCTIEDLAKATDTSKSTVSRVLTGKGYVSESVRQRILTTSKQLAYRPQKSHKMMRANDMILVIACLLNSEVQVTLANSIRSTLKEAGKKTAIVSVDFGSSEIYDYLNYAVERNFGGIIFLGVLDTPQLRETMKLVHCPVVMLNQEIEGVQSHKVQMQDYQAAYQATEYLLAKGHRDIAFLNGFENAVAIADRERGFCDAMEKHGFSREQFDIHYKGFDEISGRQFAEEIVQRKLSYTAVLTANEMLAIGLHQRLKQLKVQIGKEVSILSFDDTLMMRVCEPSITAVHYDFEQVGKGLAEILLEVIEKPFVQTKVLSYSPQLVERESVADKT